MRTFICGLLFPVAKTLWGIAPLSAQVVGFLILITGVVFSVYQDVNQITNDD